jgi:hypothetical protein
MQRIIWKVVEYGLFAYLAAMVAIITWFIIDQILYRRSLRRIQSGLYQWDERARRLRRMGGTGWPSSNR